MVAALVRANSPFGYGNRGGDADSEPALGRTVRRGTAVIELDPPEGAGVVIAAPAELALQGEGGIFGVSMIHEDAEDMRRPGSFRPAGRDEIAVHVIPVRSRRRPK